MNRDDWFLVFVCLASIAILALVLMLRDAPGL